MGAVAQLGERELCKLEVIGSIPFSSTTLRSQEASFGWQAIGREPGENWHPAIDEEVRSEGTCFVFFLFCLLMKQKLTL